MSTPSVSIRWENDITALSIIPAPCLGTKLTALRGEKKKSVWWLKHVSMSSSVTWLGCSKTSWSHVQYNMYVPTPGWLWHILIHLSALWVWKCRIPPQQIVAGTLNVREQIVLWKKTRAPPATSAPRLCLQRQDSHYTFSKTYPLFISPYLNTISTPTHPPPPQTPESSRSKTITLCWD